MDKRIKSEKERIRLILYEAEISDKRLNMLEPIIENAACMKVKLDETMDQICEADVAVEYDNGGGQRGVRENPIFKGYEALLKSYFSAMNIILNSLPAEIVKAEAETIIENKSMLELVRDRHRKEA